MTSLKRLFDKDTWNEIFESIQQNRTRTVLTMLGVFIGIYIYIVTAGIAKGLDNGFAKQFESITKNAIFIWAQSTSKPYAGFKTGRPVQLQLSDVETLKKKVPEILAIAPRNAKGAFGSEPSLIERGTRSGKYAVYADYPEFTKIYPKSIYDGGRFINDQDIIDKRKVCVIGERLLKELFDQDENPLGEYLIIDDINFQIVGVHQFVNTGNPLDSDSDVFVPFTTFNSVFNTGNSVTWLNIAANDDADAMATEEDIKAVLRRVHQIHPEDQKAFGTANIGGVYMRTKRFSNGILFLSLLVGTATILAGVIGIGNILLVSVQERTNELGIRRAMGATPGEIRSQIILEAMVLIMLAGVLGIMAGAGTLKLVDVLTQGIVIGYENPTVPIPFVLTALMIMAVLGILIGMIPAQRAVSVRPIDALREE